VDVNRAARLVLSILLPQTLAVIHFSAGLSGKIVKYNIRLILVDTVKILLSFPLCLMIAIMLSFETLDDNTTVCDLLGCRYQGRIGKIGRYPNEIYITASR
jgi:hypothetical protein